VPPRFALRFVLVPSLAALCLGGGYTLGLRDGAPPSLLRPAAPAQLSADDQRAFGVVWETLTELERSYYRPDKLDARVLASAAARAMVEAVGDPATTLTSPEQADLSAAQLRGTFEGIGVEIDRRNGQLQVVAPIAGSPAERAGLRAGDVIVGVDDQDISQLSLGDVSRRIRGPRGSAVQIALLRDGSPLSATVVRDTITVESVRSRLVPGDTPLAYVRIALFSEPTARQVREHLGPLLANGAQGVVLDLRGNPGGYLSSAVDVASVFLKDCLVMYQERGGLAHTRRPYRTTSSPQAPDLPIAVLVDRGSASAAEIVAAALRDNERGVLVGEKTFGKGTVQELRRLSDDSQLRLTVAEWLTPSGHVIHGEGLLPDLAVASVEGGDAPLEAAIDHLLHGIAVARQG
jgi:carboxyl-terminal processing protease